MKRIRLGIYILIFLLFMIATGAAFLAPAVRTARLLQQSQRLRIGEATFADVDKFTDEFGGQKFPGCSEQHCSFINKVDNAWLSALHLAPRTAITVTHDIENNRLVAREVFYASGDGNAPFIARTVEDQSSSKLTNSAFEPRFNWSSNLKWRVSVHLKPTATLEERQAAYSFATNCMVRIGGCLDAQRLLPGVKWPSEGESGRVAEPSR